MKFRLSTLMLCVVTVSVFAQDKNDIFNEKTKITWLGLDFTGAKFLGDRQRLGSESDIRHLLESWNELIIKEADKYDIARALDRDAVENHIDVTTEHNAELEVLPMYSDEQKDYLHLRPNDVEGIVSRYDFKGLKGIGLMFNIESFSKLNEEGSMWVTFVNMGTKEVLFTERMTATPKGFGMRNFWAGAIYGVLEKIKKKEYEMWRKKYYRP